MHHAKIRHSPPRRWRNQRLRSDGPRNSRQGGALGMTCIATGLGTQRKQYDQATSRKDAERTFRERKGNILSQLYFSVGTQLIVDRQP